LEHHSRSRQSESFYRNLSEQIAYRVAFPLGGLDAGAPPTDLVLSGPVFPCGCVTLPLELVLVDGSLGFDWEKATDAADKTKVRAMSTRDMAHLRRIYSKSRDRLEFQGSVRGPPKKNQVIDDIDADKQAMVVKRLEDRAQMSKFAEIRETYFNKIGLPLTGRILELGCGTGTTHNMQRI
jgi:hypothetical protein